MVKSICNVILQVKSIHEEMESCLDKFDTALLILSSHLALVPWHLNHQRLLLHRLDLLFQRMDL
jgi:hypothetical protein